jgi:hypothetical protein
MLAACRPLVTISVLSVLGGCSTTSTTRTTRTTMGGTAAPGGPAHGSAPPSVRPLGPTNVNDAPRASASLVCPSDDGAPPSCALLSDASCLGATLARRACETVGPLLLPRVAERWTECLAAKAPGAVADERPNPGSPCDSGRILKCAFRAAEAACIDGSFRELCKRLAEDCADVAPEITSVRCEQLLGAFRPTERPKLIDCLEQGCGTGSFGVCLP